MCHKMRKIWEEKSSSLWRGVLKKEAEQRYFIVEFLEATGRRWSRDSNDTVDLQIGALSVALWVLKQVSVPSSWWWLRRGRNLRSWKASHRGMEPSGISFFLPPSSPQHIEQTLHCTFAATPAPPCRQAGQIDAADILKEMGSHKIQYI